MKAERIITAPFEFSRLTACDMVKETGTHGYARLCGYISPEKEMEYLQSAGEQIEVTIDAVSEDGQSKRLYCGIVEELKITCENRVCFMELTVVPYTYLLDLKPERRSFQNQDMTYEAVMSIILSQYTGGAVIFHEGDGAPAGELLVQYQETDWEFFKRLASHFHTVLVPSYTTSGVKLYVGLDECPGTAKMAPVCYQVQKMVCEHLYKEQNEVPGLVEDDALCYRAEDQELYEIGEQVEFRGRAYYIARIESRLDGHQLWNDYQLKTKAGLKVPKRYNENVIGASPDGVVTGVQGDVVKVGLRCDAGGAGGKWFAFSTVYSSPNGSGWYCMPEPGDEIRLYFPTEREKHGYVISSVHLPVSGGAGGSTMSGQPVNPGVSRSDHTHKAISTSTEKLVDLAEDYILLKGKNGMQILMHDEAGIFITSSSEVSISSSSVQIASLSGAVEISGGEGVTIAQGGNKINVAGENVIVEGANTMVQ